MKRDEMDAAAALQRALEGDEAAGEEAARLTALAYALEMPAVPARAEFKAELRRQLICQARAHAARPTALARLRGAVEERTARVRYSLSAAAVTGTLAMSLSGGAVAVAAERSLPGDPLYSVKLILEDLQLRLTPDGIARAQRQLDYAGKRLDEAEAAANAGDDRAAVQALEAAGTYATKGAQALVEGEAAAPVHEEVRAQRDEAAEVIDRLSDPSSVADGRQVLDTFDQIEASIPQSAPAQPPRGAPEIPLPAVSTPERPLPQSPVASPRSTPSPRPRVSLTPAPAVSPPAVTSPVVTPSATGAPIVVQPPQTESLPPPSVPDAQLPSGETGAVEQLVDDVVEDAINAGSALEEIVPALP